MRNYIEQNITLTDKEKNILNDAEKIIRSVISEVSDIPTQIIDEQHFDNEINTIIKATMELENLKIFSLFNYLDDKSRSIITHSKGA